MAMKNMQYLKYQELVEEHLLDFLPEVDHKSDTISKAMKYSLTAGGKRLRPILTLAACEFCDYDVEITQALPYACAVEYIHTYSLIHDDLPAMDDDDLRRGKPTNHKVFGEAVAVLAGDGLLSSAFETMNKDMLLYFDNPEMLKRRVKASYEIVKGAGCKGMIAGQLADIESENKQCSVEMLDYIHLNKTAALIKAAVRAGAHLGGADVQKLQDLTTYAECLGLGFQIADDILDITGDEAILGKKTGADAERNKSTYPALYGLETSRKRLQELTDTALKVLSPYYDDAELLVNIAEDLAVRVK